MNQEYRGLLSLYFSKMGTPIAISILIVIAGAFLSSCANKDQKFSESSSAIINTAVDEISESPTNIEDPAPPPYIVPPIGDNTLIVQGLATGVASITQPGVWEKWAPRGTTIQLHYNVAGMNSFSTAFQIVKRGSVVQLGQALDAGSLAEGEDGRPYSFAQYFNLEKSVGGYIFNLPLKFKMNANNPTQYLKIGSYSIYLTACSGTVLSTCTMSSAIDFEVR